MPAQGTSEKGQGMAMVDFQTQAKDYGITVYPEDVIDEDLGRQYAQLTVTIPLV
jgi:hypothetical protein